LKPIGARCYCSAPQRCTCAVICLAGTNHARFLSASFSQISEGVLMVDDLVHALENSDEVAARAMAGDAQ
jgi:hypothetical protein